MNDIPITKEERKNRIRELHSKLRRNRRILAKCGLTEIGEGGGAYHKFGAMLSWQTGRRAFAIRADEDGINSIRDVIAIAYQLGREDTRAELRSAIGIR